MAIDDDVTAAVRAPEQSVVGSLHSGAAHHVTGRVQGITVIVGEHLFRDFTDISDQVGGEAIRWVEAALFVECLEFGKFIAMRGNKRLLIWCDVLFERDWLVRGSYLVPA